MSHQLEQRLQQIAQRISPCPPPDVADGWDLCAHGLPWPCPTTEAAWIARDLDRDDQIREAQRWLHNEHAAAHEHTSAAVYSVRRAPSRSSQCDLQGDRANAVARRL